MSLIDQFLPTYQFRERHALVTDAPAAALLDAVSLPSAMDDPWTRQFIRLRELPDRVLGRLGGGSGLRDRAAFGIGDFMPLGRDGDQELAFGLIGRFWQRDYGLVRLEEPQLQFSRYVEAGLAKLVLNFSTPTLDDGRTCLATETRVHCLDREAERRFRPYWLLIRPVSGLIRRRLLVRLRDAAARG